DHLHEMPRARRPGVDVAALGSRVGAVPARGAGNRPDARSKRVEDGIEHFDDLRIAADHQAISALKTPDSTRGPDVDIMDAACGAFLRTSDVILEEGVAAVDDDIAGLSNRKQCRNTLFGRRPGRDHQPEYPWR